MCVSLVLEEEGTKARKGVRREANQEGRGEEEGESKGGKVGRYEWDGEVLRRGKGQGRGK